MLKLIVSDNISPKLIDEIIQAKLQTQQYKRKNQNSSPEIISPKNSKEKERIRGKKRRTELKISQQASNTIEPILLIFNGNERNLYDLNVKDLKSVCKLSKLTITGNKNDLIQRIIIVS